MKDNKFKIMKLIGVLGIIVAIIGIALSITGFGDFETNNFMLGGLLTAFGLFVGISCLVLGFAPEISKFKIETTKYIQEQNKEDLTDIANNTADIMEDAVTKTAKAVREGFEKEATMYCKHCGAVIDSDSRFCKSCGKEQ